MNVSSMKTLEVEETPNLLGIMLHICIDIGSVCTLDGRKCTQYNTLSQNNIQYHCGKT